MNRPKLLTLLGSLGLLIGAFLPWTSMNSEYWKVSSTHAGIEGDGLITAAIGVMLLLVALFVKGKAGTMYSYFVIILSIIAGFALFVNSSNYLHMNDTIYGKAAVYSLGFGMYLSFISALLAFIGGASRVPPVNTESNSEQNAA